MTKLNFLYVISFGLALGLDFLVRKNYLGLKLQKYYLWFVKKSYFSLLFMLFFIIFTFLTLLNCLDISLYFLRFPNINFFNDDLFTNMVEKNNTTDISSIDEGSSSKNNISVNSTISGHVNEGTVNVNTPKFDISLPKEGINNLAAAVSSAGGATLGFKVAQQIPGNPALKIAAGVGVMGAVQTSTAIMSKILNNNNDKTNKFINNILTDLNYKELNDLYPDFPLNLLPEISKLVNIEILFLSILFNIFIVNLITKINYNKYIPNNKVGKILTVLISRYIRLWSNSQKFLIVISWFTLSFCIILSKICLYFILNTNI